MYYLFLDSINTKQFIAFKLCAPYYYNVYILTFNQYVVELAVDIPSIVVLFIRK